MNNGSINSSSRFSSERGSARLKLIIVGLLVAFVIYCVAQYAPVAYNAASFKDLMQRKVNESVLANRANATPSEWVEAQLRAAAPEYGIPANALINAEPRERRVVLRVQYTKPVAFPFYVYQYRFDHSVTSSSFF